jgi:hypothetical protein
MATIYSDLATAQNSALSDQSKSPSLPAYGGDLKYLDVTVSVASDITTSDAIYLCRLPKGARLVPSLISVDYGDPGDALTLKLGDASDDDRYISGLALGGSAGRKLLTEGTEGAAFLTPYKLTDAGWLIATPTTVTSAAAHSQEWHIVYTLG